MELVPVLSSNLAAVGYDHTTATLEVQFHNGMAYQYYAVPALVHQGLMTARSKGRYFDRYVKKRRYRWKQVR